MCLLCLRTGQRLAHHGLSRLVSPSWLASSENAVKAGAARAFSSLPAPVEEGKQHSKDGCE